MEYYDSGLDDIPWAMSLLREIVRLRCQNLPFEYAQIERKMVKSLEAATDIASRYINQWQPIETCPPDTEVILYSPFKNTSNPERMEIRVFKDTRSGSQHAWATHWMLLPSPPEEL